MTLRVKLFPAFVGLCSQRCGVDTHLVFVLCQLSRSNFLASYFGFVLSPCLALNAWSPSVWKLASASCVVAFRAPDLRPSRIPLRRLCASSLFVRCCTGPADVPRSSSGHSPWDWSYGLPSILSVGNVSSLLIPALSCVFAISTLLIAVVFTCFNFICCDELSSLLVCLRLHNGCEIVCFLLSFRDSQFICFSRFIACLSVWDNN